MFNKTNLKKSANVKSLIENYAKIKESLDIKDNLILIELNKLNLDKANIDIDNLSDGFIKDCIGNPDLKISKIFLEVFNEEFSNLDIEGYETVFKNETDVHFKFFNLLELKNLTQTSLDVFEKNLIERLKSIDKIETQRWEIFSIFDSNNSNISIVNILKNILDEILVSKIELKLNTSKRLLPYFVKYDLLKNRNDIFRLVIKNEFLLDSEFIKLITTNSNYIKDLYNNANPLDKEGFRNLLNEKRKDNSEFEDLAISLDIKKSKE